MKILKLMLCAVALLLSCALLKAQNPGDLDLSFNGTGWLRIGYPNASCAAMSVLVEADGRIVVGGVVQGSGGAGACLITRIKESGSLDSTFGTNGFSIQALGGGGCDVSQVLQLPNGKYLACGGRGTEGMLLRLNADGSLDGTFGGGGYLTFNQGTLHTIKGMLPLADGRTIVYGLGAFSPFITHIVALRVDAEGVVDSTYGVNGVAMYQRQNYSTTTHSAVLQSDEKVAVMVNVGSQSPWGPHSVIRLDTAGVLDTTFGVYGVHLFAPNEFQSSVAIIDRQSDDRLLIAGNVAGSGAYEQGIFRLYADGGIDSSFGTNGVYTLPYPSTAIEMPDGMTVLPDDRIVTCGSSMNTSSSTQAYVSRSLAAGNPDPAFGGNGIVLPNLFPDSKTASDLKVMADGRIVVSGYITNAPATSDMFVFRLIGESGLGLEDKEPVSNTLGLKVYPIPSGGMLGVRYFLKAEGRVTVEVADLQGRVYGTDVKGAFRNAGPQEERLDLGEMGLSGGVYFLKVSTDAERETKKLVYLR